jgi:hypothetical protein
MNDPQTETEASNSAGLIGHTGEPIEDSAHVRFETNASYPGTVSGS